jgi:hypothetical protein
MNSPVNATINPGHNLRQQLEKIGLHAVSAQLDDMLAHATEQRWSPRQQMERIVQIEMVEKPLSRSYNSGQCKATCLARIASHWYIFSTS